MNKFMSNGFDRGQWLKMMPSFLNDDFFSNFQHLFVDHSEPKVNIYESGNELLCIIAIPGLKHEDVDIYAYERHLEVKGTIQLTYNGFRIIKEEIPAGSFKRTIELPYPVREDKVDATYQRGVLIVHMHRLIRSTNLQNKIQVKNVEEE